jgi:uncharacterized UPF0160 family protein
MAGHPLAVVVEEAIHSTHDEVLDCPVDITFKSHLKWLQKVDKRYFEYRCWGTFKKWCVVGH